MNYRYFLLIFLTGLAVSTAFSNQLSAFSAPLENRFSLLVGNADGFDFRDGQNRPIPEERAKRLGLRDKTERVFLESARDLLLLGKTQPARWARRLAGMDSGILERLKLLAKKAFFLVTAFAASGGFKFLIRSAAKSRVSTVGSFAGPRLTAQGLRFLPASLIPLRL